MEVYWNRYLNILKSEVPITFASSFLNWFWYLTEAKSLPIKYIAIIDNTSLKHVRMCEFSWSISLLFLLQPRHNKLRYYWQVTESGVSTLSSSSLWTPLMSSPSSPSSSNIRFWRLTSSARLVTASNWTVTVILFWQNLFT